MPLSEHYQGAGAKVMANMRRQYGNTEKAKRIFYATEQARKRDGVDHEIGRTIKSIRRKHRISRVMEK